MLESPTSQFDMRVIDIDYTSIIWHNIKDSQSKVVYTSIQI